EMPNLADLSLANSGLGDTALAHLSGLKKLRRLVLDGNPIAGHGLSSLKDLATLRELSLNTATLTDLFAGHLAELKQLEKLSLAGSGLSDKGLKYLYGLSNLKYLDLTGTKVSKDGVAALQKALPGCMVAMTRDADRQAAEWVLSLGGDVVIAPWQPVKAAKEL